MLYYSALGQRATNAKPKRKEQSKMTKKFFTVTRYEYDASQCGIADEIVENLHAQSFASQADALKWILEYARNDLASIVGDDRCEKILKSHQSGDFILPKGLEVLVLPYGGGDRAIIETKDQGFYYRVETSYVSIADNPQ